MTVSLRMSHWVATLPFAAAILATRLDHFGGPMSLPDVTLAAFFLAGLWIRSAWPFLALFAAAAVADLWAFQRGVSDWCFTAAYPWLIPTYACLWFAGVASRGRDVFTPQGAARVAALFIGACLVAFVVSSGSFFLFSGYFEQMSAAAYARAVVRYVPLYVGWAALYASLALVGARVFRKMRAPAVADGHA
jgi:hypothetical protein